MHLKKADRLKVYTELDLFILHTEKHKEPSEKQQTSSHN